MSALCDTQIARCEFWDGRGLEIHGIARAMYRKWLSDALDRLGPKKTRSGLARHLGKSPSAITLMVQGKQHIPAATLPDIAAYLGLPLPTHGLSAYTDNQIVDVVGVLMTGSWNEAGVSTRPLGKHIFPLAPDPRYADQKQYSMLVGSADVTDLLVGEYGHFFQLGPDDNLVHDDIVHVKTSKADLVENSARRVRIVAGQVWLDTDAINGTKKKSTKFPAPNITVVGVLIGVYRQFRR